jgi:hypothetical protein
MKKTRSTPVTYRDGGEVKAPRGITAAQLQLMHDAYWFDPTFSAEERAMRAARLVKAHDDSRRMTGTALSSKARQKPERDALIRKLRAAGKRMDQIRANKEVIKLNGNKVPSVPTVNRIAPSKK